MPGTPDRITTETLRYLELLQHELAAFHGFRKLWADGIAGGKPRLPLDELLRDQAKQIHAIAYAALCAQQTVSPGRTPHTQFAYVRDARERPGNHIVETLPQQDELMRICRQVAETVMGWTWLPQHPDAPGSGPVYAIPRDRYPLDPYRPAASFLPAEEGPQGAGAAAEVIDAMTGHGFWCQTQSAFAPGSGDLCWAGFTSHGVTGWNGTPDHWTGTPHVNLSVCLAALAALKERRSDPEAPGA